MGIQKGTEKCGSKFHKHQQSFQKTWNKDQGIVEQKWGMRQHVFVGSISRQKRQLITISFSIFQIHLKYMYGKWGTILNLWNILFVYYSHENLMKPVF